MHIAPGNKITIIAPAGGFKKDVPVKYGSLIVVPVKNATEGQEVTAHRSGLFSGPIKAGDNPTFMGEAAYFADGAFTKTKPETGVTVAVGAFIDEGVLLTGVLVE